MKFNKLFTTVAVVSALAFGVVGMSAKCDEKSQASNKKASCCSAKTAKNASVTTASKTECGMKTADASTAGTDAACTMKNASTTSKKAGSCCQTKTKASKTSMATTETTQETTVAPKSK